MLDTDKVAAARLWAASRFPYLASAIFAQTVLRDGSCRTVAVDSTWHLHVDPGVVDGLVAEELGRLVVHLTAHLLRDHAGRAAALGLDAEGAPARWNRAADAEVNDDLQADGAVPASAPDLPVDLGCGDGQLAESYFSAAGQGPRRWDCGSGCDGTPRAWDGDGGIDRDRAHLLTLGVAAEMQRHHGTFPGTVPGGWLRWAERVLPPRVDWRRVLAAEIRRGLALSSGRVDYSYRRPSRRSSAVAKVVLPTLVRPVPNVAVVCDTSGSMDEELLARALAEVEGILARAGLGQVGLRVLAVDTTVHAVRRVSRASEIQLVGGGGTDMGAGIAEAAALAPRPSVVVVLTDGFTPWPPEPPKGVRVVVGLLQQPQAPAVAVPVPNWARVVLIPATGHGPQRR